MNKIYRNLLAAVAIVLFLTYVTEGTFLTPRNLTNLSRQVAINGSLAVGMTFVILIGGIDLSIGSVVALAGVAAGLLHMKLGLAETTGLFSVVGAGLSVLAAVGTGLICGSVNGWLITRFQIVPFIITLGMMVVARGLALIFSNGSAIAPLSDAYNWIGQEYVSPTLSALFLGLCSLALVWRFRKDLSKVILSLAVLAASAYVFCNYRGIPVPFVIFASLAVVGSFLLQNTRLGRFVVAIGGNPEAAWLAGIPIREITFGTYAAIGAIAGLSGAILSARLNGAMPTAGELFELDAIAAVVIGGTSLRGGIGTVRGSILGALFIATMNNGMSLEDIPEFYQKVVKGLIIILAVWADTRQVRIKAKASELAPVASAEAPAAV